MESVRRIRRRAWAVGALLLAFPACSVSRVGPAERLTLPPQLLTHRDSLTNPSALAMKSAVVPAAAQLNVDEPKAPHSPKAATSLPSAPSAASIGKPLPIDLPTALRLSSANPLDIRIADERVNVANAQLRRANVLWLPNVGLGVDYFRHDGQIQDVGGRVFTTSKSSLLVGAGPTAVFSVGDACYAPLAARQVVRARQADAQAVRNDTTLQVAEAYFTVQQARGEVGGAIDALRRADELVNLTEKVAPDFAPSVEVNRAKVESARRRQAVEAAYERWQVASADLTRLLRLEPGTLVEPIEEPAITVELLDPAASPDQLIPLALTHRPELASDQAVIQAALARVRQERVRPYVPGIAVRGVGSNTPGLAGGYFGGGRNDFLGNFGARLSVDIQAVWEVQNLGLGNRAVTREREAEQRETLLRLMRTQELVAAEVVQAHAQLRRSANRLRAAEDGVANAVETAEKNLKGLVPGKRVGDQLVLVTRPQEAVAAIASLDQAYRDYYAAVGDQNRAQFRLYRALGHPARSLTNTPARPAEAPVTMPPEAKVTPSLPPVKPPEAPAALSAPANPVRQPGHFSPLSMPVSVSVHPNP